MCLTASRKEKQRMKFFFPAEKASEGEAEGKTKDDAFSGGKGVSEVEADGELKGSLFR